MTPNPKQSVLRRRGQSVLQKPRGQDVLKAHADVVFVLDRSFSMCGCFDGVADWIGSFVEGVAADTSVAVDLRFGFLCYDYQEVYRLREWFTESAERFGSAIRSVDARGGDEMTLAAMDMACSFPWRDGAHRFMVVMTDEPTAGGHEPGLQEQRVGKVKEKLLACSIKLRLIGPECSVFARLNGLPHFVYTPGEDTQAFCDMGVLNQVMDDMGKTVSRLSRIRAASAPPATASVFGDMHSFEIHEI